MAYATAEQFGRMGLAADSWWDAPDAVSEELDAASSLADSYLRLHYATPLQVPYPAALVQKVCHIAAYNLISTRGFNPDGDASIYQSRHDSAVQWLRDVGSGKAAPIVVEATGTAGDTGGPFVVQPQVSSGPGGPVLSLSSPKPRGW